LPFRRPLLRYMAVALFAAGCGSGSPPTPIDAPKITCPGPLSITVTGLPVTVTYPSATVAGGTLPVSIVCSPLSGSSFPAGSTPVSCTATDSQRRLDSCSFTVAVTVVAPAPRISATRYVAFGDSITEGKLGPNVFTPDPRFPNSYAGFLYNLLTQRYSVQTIDMFDEGFGGECTQGVGCLSYGVSRLPGVLSADVPQVLLLQEGANDLILGGAAAIPGLVSGLRTMIQEARRRSIIVFLGTLLPQRAGGLRAGNPALIPLANAQIRGLAISEGATLVDLYEAFGGSPDPWIDSDGLHATKAGYTKIAETFFNVIRSRLETQPGSSSGQPVPAGDRSHIDYPAP
jgi:lysophospholipase L1-like esterase